MRVKDLFLEETKWEAWFLFLNLEVHGEKRCWWRPWKKKYLYVATGRIHARKTPSSPSHIISNCDVRDWFFSEREAKNTLMLRLGDYSDRYIREFLQYSS